MTASHSVMITESRVGWPEGCWQDVAEMLLEPQ